MSKNHYFNEEESNQLVDQEKFVYQPWSHQFDEEEDAQTTRSAKNHKPVKASNLYTKIIFAAITLAILVVAIWAILRGLNIIGSTSNQNSTTPAVPRLVLQSQTTTTSSVASDESSTASGSGETVSSSANAGQETTTTTTANTTQTTPATGGQTYTIKAGDSAYSIAQRHGITVAQFYALNGLNANSTLLPGRSVIVSSGNTASGTTNTTTSTNRPATTTGNTYTIKAGDSLSSIAARHGMTLSELKQLNGLNDNSLLLPGKTLKVR